MGSEWLPAKVMHCSIIGWRNQGRQPKKCIENIKQDIDTRNIQFDEAMEKRTYLDTFDLSTYYYESLRLVSLLSVVNRSCRSECSDR